MQQLLTMSSARSCLTAARNSFRLNVFQSTRSCSILLHQSLSVRENAAHQKSNNTITCSTRTFVNSRASVTQLTRSMKRTSVANFASLPDHSILPMPALSPTMVNGEISEWFIAEGDHFKEGQAILQVDTDKATMAYNATEEGYLAKILMPAGSSKIEVGIPIMITVEEQADVAAFANYSPDSSASTSPVAAPAATTPAAKDTAIATPAASPVASPIAPPSPVIVQQETSNGRAVASPFARKLLRDAGLPPSALLGMTGSGAGGRIVSADVLAAIAAGIPAAVSPSASVAAPAPAHISPAQAQVSSIPGIYSDFELSDIARAVAARHTSSMQQVPHYYLSVELNLSNLLALRESLNGSKSKGKGPDLSVLDFFVKASALAVGQVPDVNSAWMDKFVRRYDQVDINLIVGTGAALSTPLLRNVQSRGLSSISSEVTDFEDLLFNEEGSVIDASRLAVGTFSIHNLGMYGVKSASPIVLAPQACALALGSIIDTVVPRVGAKEGENDWVVAPVMIATLSCDHRVVDGAVGAQWLAALKTFIENPTSMLL